MRKHTTNTIIKTEDLIDRRWITSGDEQNLVIRKPPKGPSLVIQKSIEIDKDLAWSLGFYLAEGTKVSYCVGVSNCELSLLKSFQKSLLINFGIQYEWWRIYCKSISNENEDKEKIYSESFKTKNVKIKYSKKATKDNIEIRLNNTLFSIIFNNFVKKSLRKIYQDNDLLLSFIKGYEIGDGSIIQRNGFLYGIVITVKNKEIKNFLFKSFKKLYGKNPRVRINKNVYEICFAGVIPLIDIILDRHFESIEYQWKKLISTFLKKEYTRSHVRYWLSIRDSALPIYEIIKMTNRSHWAVRDALNKDAKLGIVKLEKKIIPRKAPIHNFYSLTNKGKELLDILEEVR